MTREQCNGMHGILNGHYKGTMNKQREYAEQIYDD